MDTLLEVKDLKKYFPVKKGLRQFLRREEQKYVKAVDGVSFTLGRGKVLVLAGESGSGKTTVAKLVLRAIEPDEGSIIFEGNDITRYSGSQLKHFRASVHMVYQDPYASLDPRMRIIDSVTEPLTIHCKDSPKSQQKEKALKALEQVKLHEAVASSYPHMLSGGQRQRVAIARALVTKPSLIVADEPVSMLDVSVRGEVLGLMQDLKESFGISYIYITHDLSTARYVGDSIAIMNAGRIVETGPIDRVLSKPEHNYTRSLIEAIPDPDSIGGRL